MFQAIGSALGGIFGGLFGKSDAERAQELREQALGQFAGMSAPEIKEIMLAKYASQGEITPEAEQAIEQAASKMEQIQLDPKLREARLQALAAAQESGRTGLTAADRQALNETRLRSLRDQQARQSQIMQNMAARGMGGSGQELAAALASSQAGAEEAAAQGDRLSAMAQERRLQAIREAADMAGDIRASDMDEQSAVAEAVDRRNQFNEINSINLQSRNVEARNLAQRENLQNRQNLANQNVDLGNQQEKFNKVERIQKMFDNQMDLARAKANALTGAAGSYESSSAGKTQAAADAFSGLGSVAQGIWGGNKSQEDSSNSTKPKAASNSTKPKVASNSTKLKAMLNRGILS